MRRIHSNWRTILIAFFCLVVTLLVTYQVDKYQAKWQSKQIVVLTFFFGLVITGLSILVTIFWDMQNAVKESINQFPALVEKNIRQCSIHAPGGISRGFQDIVRTIFNIDHPEMQTEVITFTIETLDNIKQKNGFPLSEQRFRAYRDRARNFCAASKQSIEMTCLYSPIEYLTRLVDNAEPNPSHLELFNGMDKSLYPNGPKELERTRVMCISDKLQNEIQSWPQLFSAAYIWFLFHNINFTHLYWSIDSPSEDLIIFDEKYMWKYNPEASILYLKCAWEGATGREQLSEKETYFSKEPVGKYADTFNMHLHKIDRSGNLWNHFLEGLKGYLSTVSSTNSRANNGFSVYKVFAQKLQEQIDSESKFLLLHWMKEIYNNLMGHDARGAETLSTFMIADFDDHVREFYPREIEKALNMYRNGA